MFVILQILCAFVTYITDFIDYCIHSVKIYKRFSFTHIVWNHTNLAHWYTSFQSHFGWIMIYAVCHKRQRFWRLTCFVCNNKVDISSMSKILKYIMMLFHQDEKSENANPKNMNGLLVTQIHRHYPLNHILTYLPEKS